jgi:predicted ATPase
VPLHTKDLANKLQESIYSYNNTAPEHSLKDTYKGNFYFDKDISQFVLDRGKYTINASNVASGIKNLGVFDILVNAGHINDMTLTILDEPEINLHPEWQIRYAQTICSLAAAGANIIVTTHSPYILEALHGFSKKFELDSNFYLARKPEELSFFEDVTHNMSKAMKVLSAPLYRLNEDLNDDF